MNPVVSRVLFVIVINFLCIYEGIGFRSSIYSGSIMKMRKKSSLLSSRVTDVKSSVSEKKMTEGEVRLNIRTVSEFSAEQEKYFNRSSQQYLDFDDELLRSLKVKKSFCSVIAEKCTQAIDDYLMHSNIRSVPWSKRFQQPLEKVENTLKREQVVILGTGWGSHALLKTIDSTKYDVKIISPRNYFAFTPMLAASAVGTVEFRSLCEPIRNVNPLADYLEASAEKIDFLNKTINCLSIKCEGTACDITRFKVNYDYLIISVGATVNTFGIKGVREHCQFLKQVEDAANLRKAIANSFERANIPNLQENEIRNALSFVIVGAGPTGVEFTSELRDWVENEGRKYYPHLLKYMKITLIEAGHSVLPIFDETLQQEALKRLTDRKTRLIQDGLIAKEVTEVKLKCGVKEIADKEIILSSGDIIPYGFCVWAAGNGPVPLVLHSIEQIPAQQELQSKARGKLVVDEWLRVKGLQNVYALGDCTYQISNPLPATAQVASQQGAYLGRLFSKGYYMDTSAPTPLYKVLDTMMYGQREEAINIHNGTQIGKFLEATNFIKTTQKSSKSLQPADLSIDCAKPFEFFNLGVLAYIGSSEALAQVNVDTSTIRSSGLVGFLLWRGVYWFKQVSWRNRVMVGLDWLKARWFGRDLGAL